MVTKIRARVAQLIWLVCVLAALLLAVGALTSLLTGKHALGSAMRQLAIGVAAMAITYGIGALVGTQL